MRNPIPINIGQRIGRLTLLSEGKRHITSSGKSLRTIVCKCDCGNEKIILLDNLIKNNPTKSCGCIAIEKTKTRNKKHGLFKHTLYRKWFGMKTRCYNPNYHNYDRYGGRGIEICDDWKENFEAFYNWSIENGWEEGLEIDRIDVDGNYEPSNCRFITGKDNTRNRSCVKLNFETAQEIRNAFQLIPGLTQKEVSQAYNIHASTVNDVINNRIWAEGDII